MRRKEIKGLLKDFASHFVSRNNDYGGYWTIGQLRTIVKFKKTENLYLNLTVVNSGSDLEPFERKYKEYLNAKLKQRGTPEQWLNKAYVSIDFTDSPPRNYLFWGERLTKCTVTITVETDFERVYSASSHCYCVSHKPAKEQRRAHF